MGCKTLSAVFEAFELFYLNLRSLMLFKSECQVIKEKARGVLSWRAKCLVALAGTQQQKRLCDADCGAKRKPI
jgi:hypothetical protein